MDATCTDRCLPNVNIILNTTSTHDIGITNSVVNDDHSFPLHNLSTNKDIIIPLEPVVPISSKLITQSMKDNPYLPSKTKQLFPTTTMADISYILPQMSTTLPMEDTPYIFPNIAKSDPIKEPTFFSPNKTKTLFPMTNIIDRKYRLQISKSTNIPNENTISGGTGIDRSRLILDTPFSTRSTISYGLIVFAKDTGKWAIIQRKHSVEFLLFIRGSYRLTYLPLLLSCITKDESLMIEKSLKGGPSVFKNLYLNELDLCPQGLEYALIRMAESRNIVLNLISKLDLSKNILSWTWPKGSLHISSNRETPFDCAKREFVEEVEIILPPPLFISNSYISENIKTITGRNIESRYWIYVIPNEIQMFPPKSHPEVSNRMWVGTEKYRTMIHQDDLFMQIMTLMFSIINTSNKVVIENIS